ncbi:MAG: diguanylate cyclase [Desulfovibrionaceae bacterium]|nr:diguanylate cyclase [Desulfovibrionaceae bacterium]
MTGKTSELTLEAAQKRVRTLATELEALNRRLDEQDREQRRARSRQIRYERIISSTPDLISLVDGEYRYRMVNDAYLENFRLTRGDILNRTVADILGSKLFRDVVKRLLDRALAGETVRVETWIDLPEQGRRFFATTYHPVSIDGVVEFVAVDSHDMTELKRKEEALQTTARRLDMATDAGNIGIWERDLATDENYWDKKTYELYRVEPGEFGSIYEAWRARIHPDDFPEVEQKLAECIETKERYEMEYRLVWPDDDIRIIRVAGTVQTDEDGSPVLLTGVNWDVTEHRRMEDELRLLASTDPLTGASNRRHFMGRLNDELERCRRYETPMVLLSLDIDHFKDINDTFGHPAGDEVLKDLVRLCTRTLRTTDVFGRVGGEEFLAALTQTGLAAGLRTAERLRRNIERHAVSTHGHSISYTISIGLTQLQAADETIDALLHRADEALYKAKHNGRNRVEIA